MTTKADYTAEEWELIMRAPFMAAMAVVAASPSGPIGFVKEMFAVGGALQAVTHEGSPNTLVGALVADVTAGHRPAAPTESPQDGPGATARGLQACRDVAALLARKTPGPEAEGFKRWLLSTAPKPMGLTVW